jgi:ATP synthase protein I
MTDENSNKDQLVKAARTAAKRNDLTKSDPEPSLGRRFGQIGILGWMIVIPVLAGILAGSFLDRVFHSGIAFSAALTMAGAALGLWLAFRWMHEQ